MTNFERIAEFHAAVDGEKPLTPRLPSKEILDFRETLLHEEYTETLTELNNLDKTSDIADAVHELVDLLYVTYGAIYEFGVDADAVFAEVHSANMRKLAGPKRADGKQLKPEGWQGADVKRIIEDQRSKNENQSHSRFVIRKSS